MITQKEFDSEFCNVKYIEKDNIILLTWKKFCCYDDYRNPTIFALELLKKYKDSNFILDARDGFEDEEEDVQWGFAYLLPEMAKTNCKKVAFIMNAVNAIEEEMNMWEKEFRKYFIVLKGNTYIEVLQKM